MTLAPSAAWLLLLATLGGFVGCELPLDLLMRDTRLSSPPLQISGYDFLDVLANSSRDDRERFAMTHDHDLLGLGCFEIASISELTWHM